MKTNEYIQPSVEFIELGADIITSSSIWDTPEIPITPKISLTLDDLNQEIE